MGKWQKERSSEQSGSACTPGVGMRQLALVLRGVVAANAAFRNSLFRCAYVEAEERERSNQV